MSGMSDWGRRRFLGSAALGAAFWTTPGLFAQEVATPTSPMGEGPFYPDKMPLDTDNDLLVINDSVTPSVGEITYLGGRILTKSGTPVRNAFVEIWQVDNAGSYLHTQGGDPKTRDGNFQGYGRFLTDSKGNYYFRTIKPVPYRLFGIFRAPHIHFAVSLNGKRLFTTQAMVKGHEDNAKDGLLNRIKGKAARESVMVDYTPLKGSKIGALSANFDIILGKTPEDSEDGKVKGGIGERQFKGEFRPPRRRPREE